MMGPMHVRLVRNEGDVPVEISGTYVFPGHPTSGYRPTSLRRRGAPTSASTRLPHRRKIDQGIAGALQLRYIQ
jgi:hypothetical protein